MSATRIKAADRTKVCQQLTTELKKQYGSRVPKSDRDVLDSLLFAVCLEDATQESAEAALLRLHDSFFDYNEARVSSITELQRIFSEMSQPEWRAMRIRESLQYVFEGRYSYDLEDFRKKNLDSAEKYLKNIKSLTPFVIGHTMLTTLQAHIAPCSESILKFSIWLGLLPEDTDVAGGGDTLKAAVRKSDSPLFVYLINEAANDPKYQEVISTTPLPDQDADPLDTLNAAPGRFKDLVAGKSFAPKKSAKKKSSKSSKSSSSAKKESSTAKKSTKKKTTKKATKKSSTAAAKKKTAKKTTKKKTTKKKSK